MAEKEGALKNICVYCAASTKVEEKYFKLAEDTGRIIAKRGYGLVYGGGADGLMGAVARGAHAEGGYVIGVSPTMFDEVDGVLYDKLDEKIITKDMRERKATMEGLSDAFIALPGGLGTLDEIIEMYDFKQLCLHEKAMVIVNFDGYYDPLLAMIKRAVTLNFAKEATLGLCEIVPTLEEAMDYIEKYAPPHADVEEFRYFDRDGGNK